MSQSIGSPGVVGNTIGEDGGAGVWGLEGETVFIPGARRPDEKRFEYAGMMVVGQWKVNQTGDAWDRVATASRRQFWEDDRSIYGLRILDHETSCFTQKELDSIQQTGRDGSCDGTWSTTGASAFPIQV